MCMVFLSHGQIPFYRCHDVYNYCTATRICQIILFSSVFTIICKHRHINGKSSSLINIRDTSVVKRWTRDRKVSGTSPGRSGREFSSPGSTLCADSYLGIRSTPVLPQQYVKDPGHSSKRTGGRSQLNAPYNNSLV